MKIEAARYIKPIFLLCLLCTAVNTQALVMGDLQVSSSLGQPLSAKIAFADLSDVDVQLVTIRLAGADDYRKLGMQYPESHKFRFTLVNESSAMLPFIRVSTSYPLDDPFINLLVEVSSPAGKLFKAYTFLLDPPAEFSDYQLPIASPSSDTSRVVPVKADVTPVKARARQVKKRKNPGVAVRTERNSQMKLAMSLSISSYDSAQADSRDALQEELIAKEKALQELNLQLGEMQTVIKSLQDKRALVSPSSVEAVSPLVGASIEIPLEAPVVQAAKTPPEKNELNTVLAIIVFLLAGIGGSVWHFKFRRMHWQRGPFDEVHEETAPVVEAEVQDCRPPLIKPEPPDATMPFPTAHAPFTSQAVVAEDMPPAAVEHTAPLTFEKITVGERTIETAAYAERAVPPEYAILMEANRHLRAGNDQLAETSLNQAIEANPKNLYGYQALLGIYEKRADLPGFERIVQQIKTLGEETAFKEAAVRGRALDPENLLYQTA
jgi:hypothetical protein